MNELGTELLHNEAGKLRDQLANGMPKSHMGYTGMILSNLVDIEVLAGAILTAYHHSLRPPVLGFRPQNWQCLRAWADGYRVLDLRSERFPRTHAQVLE